MAARNLGESTARKENGLLSTTPRTIRMTLEYDGSPYVGWQRQPNGLSVQEVVEEALGKHLRQRVTVIASGRTDAGVHALGQVISFRCSSSIPLRGIHLGTQALLPPTVSIRDACEASPDFDARRLARLRWYRFFLLLREIRPGVAGQYLTQVRDPLNLDLMENAAEVLAGEHDFQAFRASTCEANRTVLNLHRPRITPAPDQVLILDFRCRSFLQNMVRILAGSMVAVAQRRMSVNDLRQMLATGTRPMQATTLPPHGLFLYRVFYEGEEGEEGA